MSVWDLGSEISVLQSKCGSWTKSGVSTTWVPGTLMVLLSRDRVSRLCVALKQHICLNERSDRNRCNTCSRADSTPAKDTGNSEKWVTFHTRSNITARAGCGEKSPTGPFAKDNRSAPLRTPTLPPARGHECDRVLWHLEMTWHSLYEWTATTFSFWLRFHSTLTSGGDWYK